MAHGHGHGIVEGDNKKIAILISVLALFLAIAETLGKSAQTEGLSSNIEASDLWAFYQAKTIRKTTLETAAQQMDVDLQLARDAGVKEILEKRIKGWKDNAARYESEPDTKEGRKELRARALEAQAKSKLALEKYHHLELASAAFQIAIVLASSFIITQVIYLLWGALGVGALGILFGLIGLVLLLLIPAGLLLVAAWAWDRLRFRFELIGDMLSVKSVPSAADFTAGMEMSTPCASNPKRRARVPR
jgi:hypothetical protein